MRKLVIIFLFALSLNVNAEQLEKLALKQLPKIAALYADGYARLVKASLKAKLLYKDKEGECTIITAFKMEAFNGAPNFTQFISFFNCPTVHRVLRPNKKLFMSDMFRFYMGEPYLDISTARINGDYIQVKGRSIRKKTPVVTIFEPSPGPGWWQLKKPKIEMNTEVNDEILPAMQGRF